MISSSIYCNLHRYKKYVLLDPLGMITKTRAAVTEGAAGPADAPTTIVQREELQRQQQESYFYVPGIGNVPEIAVPDFLPNLLGELSFFKELAILF